MKAFVRCMNSTVVALALILGIIFSCLAAEDSTQDYTDLFHQAHVAGNNLSDLAPALSDAFHNDPVVFLKALHLEGYPLAEKIASVIKDYHQDGSELEYMELVLNVYSSEFFTSSEMNTVLLFLEFHQTDMSGADDGFLDSLFNALRHSDGIGTDKCGSYLYKLFLDNPVWIVQRIIEQDEAFREFMVITLNYQCYATEARYSEILNDLSKSQELSETGKVFVAKLLEKFVPTESTTTETEVIDSIPTEDQNVTEPVTTKHGSDSQYILPIAFGTILLIGFGAVLILEKKKSQNNA